MSRTTPFDLVFGELAAERFPVLKASLAGAGIDSTDRDAFTLDGAAAELLRDLMPEDAPPESLHEFIALLQHAYLFWQAGSRVIVPSGTDLPSGDPTAGRRDPSLALRTGRLTVYVQLPDHLYWGRLEPDVPHEPLDGFFVHPLGDGLRVLGIFGLHPQRPGFTVAEVSGRPDRALQDRPGGSAPYAPLMEGGVAAGIRSIHGREELLVLAWHALASEG